MKPLFSFFFIFLLIGFFPFSDAATVTANARINEIVSGLTDDDFTLDPGEELDLSEDIEQITEEETIGGTSVTLTQKVTLNSANDEPIELVNTDLQEVTVEIPNGAGVAGPTSWDGTISPPTLVATSGTVPTGFQTPSSSIAVGDPNVILVFDIPVIILIEDTTGQIAYKLSGTNNWVLISSCSGSFATPTDPVAPGECSITNGVDTKIVTFHFTEFGPLEEDDPEEEDPEDDPEEEDPEDDPEPKSKTTQSGGSGRTGVGPDSVSPGQVFVPSLPEEEETKVKLPNWFRAVVFWWAEGKITEEEMNIAMQYLFKIL